MEMKKKKYPIMISLIASCVIVVVSIFILAFFGMNLGTSLGGGSQFEITISDEASTTSYVKTIKSVLGEYNISVDTTFVEDKFIAGETEGDFTTRCLVVKLSSSGISEETQSQIKTSLAEALGIQEDAISDIEDLVSSVSSKEILYIGLAVGIIAICLFVFAWLRYNIFAGLSILLGFLHNIILYFAILILSRIELSVYSLAIAIVLTLIMGGVLISIFEKYREKDNLHLDDKLSVTERMIQSEKQAVMPYCIIFAGLLVFSLLLLFVPVNSVRWGVLNTVIAMIVTAYSGLLIGPGAYAGLLEIVDLNLKSRLSRNHKVNKVIKKKIKNNDKSLALEESKNSQKKTKKKTQKTKNKEVQAEVESDKGTSESKSQNEETEAESEKVTAEPELQSEKAETGSENGTTKTEPENEKADEAVQNEDASTSKKATKQSKNKKSSN